MSPFSPGETFVLRMQEAATQADFDPCVPWSLPDPLQAAIVLGVESDIS